MEKSDHVKKQPAFLMCESNFNPVSIYSEFKKAISDRQASQVRHILTRHLNFSIAERKSAQTLMHGFFKNTADILQLQGSIIKIIKLFLENEISLKAKDKSGQTGLHLAVKRRLTLVIDYLISRGANLRVRSNPILHFLIKKESKKFKKENQAPNSSEIDKEKSINFIEWMIQKGLDVDSKDENGDTALHLAVKYKLLHALPVLLKYTKDTSIVNNGNMTAFQVFAESVPKLDKKDNRGGQQSGCWHEMYEKFLLKGFSVDVVDKSGRTPLHHALNQSRLRVATLMLMNFKNVNARDNHGNTVLHVVMDNLRKDDSRSFVEHREIVRILVSKGANVYMTNDKDVSPLLDAVMDEYWPLLKVFIEHGAEFHRSYRKSNLLHLFCKSMVKKINENYRETLDFLFSNRCDVNAKDTEGKTPLHYAARCVKPEIAEKLVKPGANVNVRESVYGYTPLHEAVKYSHEKNVILLKQNGADVHARTMEGQNALHLYKDANIARKLLEYGVQVDVMDDKGSLPLQIAIHNHRRIVIDEQFLCILKLLVTPFMYENCLKEVETLKSYEITNNMSLYDLLHNYRHTSRSNVMNQKLKKVISSPTLNKQFTLYHGLISAAYYMGVSRREILEPAKSAFRKLVDIVMPELCLHEIFSYLSNVSLKSLIEAAKNRR